MTQEKGKSAWKKWYWLLIAAPVTVAGFILYVLYAHRYDRTGLQLLSFLMSLCFPVTFSLAYLERDPDKWYMKLFNTFITIICVIPFIVLMIRVHNKYIRDQLKSYPVAATGHISGFKTTRNKGTVRHYAIFEYFVDHKQYRQKVRDDDERYAEGDTLPLVVSAKDPEIFEVVSTRSLSEGQR